AEPLRRRQTEQPGGIATHALDEETLDARQHEIPAEQVAGGRLAPATAPQECKDRQARQRLVYRRRMHALGRRHDAIGITHRPRQVRGYPVVAVAGELTTHTA